MRTLPASFVTALIPKAVTPKWWRTDFHVAGQSSLTGGMSLTSAICQLLIAAPLGVLGRGLSAHLLFVVNEPGAPQTPDTRRDRPRLLAGVRRRDGRDRRPADDPARPPLQPRRRAMGLPR